MENTQTSKQEENQQSIQLQQEYLALANPGVMNHQVLTLLQQIVTTLEEQKKAMERQATALEKGVGISSS